MTDIMTRLVEDHRRIGRVLAVLEEQMGLYEQGEDTDTTLLVEIMDYIRNYVSTFHHPTEDLLFRRAIERDPGLAARLAPFVEEHEGEHDQTLQLAEAIDGAFLVDQISPRGDLPQLARAYIASTRAQLQREEQDAFPLVASTLTESDWAALAGHLPAGLSAGDLQREQYRALSAEIS